MDVAEELIDSEDRIDRRYVERRLDDWVQRLEALYASISGWLPSVWSIADGESVPIHEELMERYDVPERRLPSKALLKDGQRAGRLLPRGLWIIGANGRLDLILPSRHSIIVDRAQSFEQPQWTIMPLRDRLKTQPLTEESFMAGLD